jgi:hypothetical protein
MYTVRIAADAEEAEFRAAARRCIAHNLAPEQLAFVPPDEPAQRDDARPRGHSVNQRRSDQSMFLSSAQPRRSCLARTLAPI